MAETYRVFVTVEMDGEDPSSPKWSACVGEHEELTEAEAQAIALASIGRDMA